MLFIINHLGVSKLVFYAWSEVRTLNPITQMKKEKGVGWWGVELHLLMLSCLLQFHFHWLKYTTVYLTLCPRWHRRHSHGATATTVGSQWSLLHPIPHVRPTFRNNSPHHMAKPNPCSQQTAVWIATMLYVHRACTHVFTHALSWTELLRVALPNSLALTPAYPGQYIHIHFWRLLWKHSPGHAGVKTRPLGKATIKNG